MIHEEDRTIVVRTLWLGVAAIIIGIGLPIFAYTFPWRPEGECLNTWFQRSGSVMVVISVLAEFILYKIHGLINPSGTIFECGLDLRDEYGSYYTLVVRSVAAIAVVGTIIWGYGDLLIKNT